MGLPLRSLRALRLSRYSGLWRLGFGRGGGGARVLRLLAALPAVQEGGELLGLIGIQESANLFLGLEADLAETRPDLLAELHELCSGVAEDPFHLLLLIRAEVEIAREPVQDDLLKARGILVRLSPAPAVPINGEPQGTAGHAQQEGEEQEEGTFRARIHGSVWPRTALRI